jgi:hypothetical protein
MSRKVLEIGGLVAGAILVVFGIVAIVMGVDARTTVRDSIEQEQIFFGTTDDPAVAEHASQWAEEQVLTGDQARAFALVIREHALESSGGLVYAEMGRFTSAEDPDDPVGTNDVEAALKDEAGNPVTNGPRQTWVTANALSTSLNMSYLAENLSLFGIVVGVALLLAGIGFIILAVAVLGEPREAKAAAPESAATPVVG